MISLRRISLGGGFRYLMESVAVGDGAPDRTNHLARYYAESGTPPGVFLGSGLGDLDDGRGVAEGSHVTEEHLRNLLGACADPVTGQPVGRLPNSGTKRAPVAGFDLTFSPGKSVSVAWALADEGTKALIYDCHRRAIEFVLSFAEAEMIHSRSGTNGVVEEDITGVVAAAFTHWDSRSGDPQLHDHVVIWNRARSVSDGRWRTLDSRGLFKARCALSSMHQGVLSDYLSQSLGVGWEGRARRHTDQLRWEIEGVPEGLLREFSKRVEQVELAKDGLIARFVVAHGRQPTGVEVIRLRQQATIATRPPKVHRSLAQMTEEWRDRAEPYLGAEQVAWVASLKNRNDLPLLRAGDLVEDMLGDAAEAVLVALSERRATYSPINLLDDAHRLLHGVRFASPEDRCAVAARIAELAAERSLNLTPAALHHTPARYVRPDGSTRLTPKSRRLYTTQALLDAEARLLHAGRLLVGPRARVSTVAAVAELSVDQALAMEKIATSGRTLDVLVGPAGSGKTTTMAGLRAAWEAEYGPGSVIGLAPSAAAAEVLAENLGIEAENTAKWLAEHRRLPERLAQRRRLGARLGTARGHLGGSSGRAESRLATLDADIARWQLRPGQLIIVDEASLAGTFALDELVSGAGDAGAKVLLTGDWAQLSAVEAGGAFSLLARDREDLAPQLNDVRRFVEDWEKAASLELRLGHEVGLDLYEDHGRIAAGARDEMVEAVYRAWKADSEAGLASLMIAGDGATVTELNRRARADRVAAGAVAGEGLALAGGQEAGVGDEVVTRQNNRHLTTGRRWVRNGDRWSVTATNADGSMAVRRAKGAAVVVLPADYVAEHVELAYACTAHRVQGRTVDTAHAMVSPTTTREVLYVSMTRGRSSNRLYVDTAYDPDPATGHVGTQRPQDAREVLAAVLANEGAEVSAHETIRRAQHEAESWTTLEAEYQTLAATAQSDRWEAALERSGLSADELEAVRSSPAQGALMAALREAEARGLDVESDLPRLVRARSLADAEDVAAVVHARVERWTETAGSRSGDSHNLIAGLVPRAVGIRDHDLSRALEQRDRAMELRARTLAVEAVSTRPVWLRKLGAPPADPTGRERWLRAVSTVAAYRERWSAGADNRPLGGEATSLDQLAQLRRAEAAVAAAMALHRQHAPEPASQAAVTVHPGIEVREGAEL